ncbi:radical SAM superfamily enzyme YgiQ (UPF0313 family) [Methanimicrococcus blatticola]|uniref:Radical SAM superfamily enzyme YgiQ (UPF0313 family) n=3 Tax=Methanimicrococcus blatticola TaxID=91560 RepID=A0A484F7W1_9EURY|nr:radical SAM superfamily enzyme YgiQ (UPF0313 family) [Methanimicrococcus blatticola]
MKFFGLEFVITENINKPNAFYEFVWNLEKQRFLILGKLKNYNYTIFLSRLVWSFFKVSVTGVMATESRCNHCTKVLTMPYFKNQQQTRRNALHFAKCLDVKNERNETNRFEQPLKIGLFDCGYKKHLELNEPLGIETLYSSMKNEFGNQIEIDMRFSLLEEMPDKINRYDMIMLSGNIEDQGMMLKYITMAKESGTFIVVGGVYPTLSAETLLKKHNDLVCVIGEGEIAVNQIILALLDGKDIFSEPEKINNIAYMSPDGTVKYTQRKMLDLSTVDYLPERKYTKQICDANGLVRMETSRGCDWNRCSFCMVKWKYGSEKRRVFPLKKVFQEIVNLSEQGVRRIYFTDEDFVSGDETRLSNFIKGIKEMKSSGEIAEEMEFFASTSVMYILDKEEILPDLKSIGFVGLFLGVESGSKTQLIRYKKGVTPEKNLRAIEKLKSNGLLAEIGFIFFDPKMTAEELKENIDFVTRNEIADTTSRLAKRIRIIPHTEYCENMNLDEMNIDENSLSIPYEFEDKEIGKIANEIEEEFENISDDTYKEQAMMRTGEFIKMENLNKQRMGEIEMIKQRADILNEK